MGVAEAMIIVIIACHQLCCYIVVDCHDGRCMAEKEDRHRGTAWREGWAWWGGAVKKKRRH